MQALRTSTVSPDHGLRVLRVCTSYMPPDRVLEGKGRLFDPIGGMQNHTAELTRALDGHGLVQRVVTTRLPDTSSFDRQGHRCEIFRLGVPIKRARQLYSLSAAHVLPALAREADVVHVHLGEDLAVLPLAELAARRNRLPLVMTVHCSLRHTLQPVDARTAILKTVGGAIERRAEHRADAVITLTRRLADRIATEGVPTDRIHVIPSGADPTLFKRKSEWPWPEVARPRVVFVGRLARQKGVHTLAAALPHIRTPGATVLMVGDGPERGRVEQLASAHRLEQRLRVTGFVPHQVIPSVLSHADVLVLPSVYEELGSILVEAMQAGIPVVASRTGGIPDAIEDGVNGLLVPPEDPAALATAIDRVLGDHLLAARLSAGSRRRAADYDWNNLAVKVLDVYEQVVRRQGFQQT